MNTSDAPRGSSDGVELVGYTALSAGMAMAASCYMVLGLLAGSNGRYGAIISIVSAAALCAAVALAVGELASRFPSALGIRVYTKRALGDGPSLFFTYLAIVIIGLFSGIELKVFSEALLPQGQPGERLMIAVAMITVVAGTNLRGFDLSRRMQVAIFAALITGSLAVSIFALAGSAAAAQPPVPGAPIGTLAASIGTAFFLFAGFEWVTPAARNPAATRKLIPLSMISGISILVLTYIPFTLALQRTLPPAALLGSATPHVLMAQRLLGNTGVHLMQCLSLLALTATLNAGLLGASRLLYSLARERALPGRLNAVLSVLNSRSVPSGSLLFLAAVAAVSAGVEIYSNFADMAAQTCAGLYCGVYSAFVASHVRLTRSTVRAPFRSVIPSKCYYVLGPALGVLGVLTILQPLQQLAARAALLLVVVCGCWWAASRIARSRRQLVST